jgi:hypothetical protein
MIGVVGAAVVLAACGGSANTSNSTGSGSLSALARKYSAARVKVTYRAGTGPTLTFAQNGHGKTVFGWGISTVYADGKTSVSCVGTGATAKCSQLGTYGGLSSLGASTLTAVFSNLASALSSLRNGHLSTQTIAGRTASCATFKAADVSAQLGALGRAFGQTGTTGYAPNDTATICVDQQTGFLLQFTTTKQGHQTGLAATSFAVPSDRDFTPPGTPQTLPSASLPSGTTAPGSGG